MKIKLSKTKTLVIEVLDTSREFQAERVIKDIKERVERHINIITRDFKDCSIKIEAIKFLRRVEISKIFMENDLVPATEITFSGENRYLSLYFSKTWVEANFPPEFFIHK